MAFMDTMDDFAYPMGMVCMT